MKSKIIETEGRREFRFNCPYRGLLVSRTGDHACLVHDYCCSRLTLCPRMLNYDREVLGIDRHLPKGWGEDVYDVTLEDDDGFLFLSPVLSDDWDDAEASWIPVRKRSPVAPTSVHLEQEPRSDGNSESKSEVINNSISNDMANNFEQLVINKSNASIDANNIEQLVIQASGCTVRCDNLEQFINMGSGTKLVNGSSKTLDQYAAKELIDNLRHRGYQVVAVRASKDVDWL